MGCKTGVGIESWLLGTVGADQLQKVVNSGGDGEDDFVGDMIDQDKREAKRLGCD